jgi:hypothetical protein
MEVQDRLVELHPEAKEISFKHKFVIEGLFKKKIRGILGIDYFSLMIVDACKKLSIYSSCPALEYNLIDNELWQYDGLFYRANHTESAFFFWDELYSPAFKKTLLHAKETKFVFLFGFSVMKELSDIFVIYSFATKSQHEKEIYHNSKNMLFKIGDCFFNELKSVHCQYVSREKEGYSSSKRSSPLWLVVDNTKKLGSISEVNEKDRELNE